MSPKHDVRAHVRSDGAKVTAHKRTNRGVQESVPSEATEAAAAAAASDSSPDDGWEERPVALSELSTALSAVGAGKAADVAPLVEIRRSPDGTTFTSAIMGRGEELPTGALEISDPFAVSDIEQSATVNGRFLRDAILSHPTAKRNTLTAADIDMSDGQTSVAGTEVVDVHGWSAERRNAVKEIERVEAGAAADGITEDSVKARVLAVSLAEHGIGDGVDYAEHLADRIRGAPFVSMHNAWQRYRRDTAAAERTGTAPPTPEEWVAEHGDDCREQAERAAYGSAARQAVFDYQAELGAWAERNGHNLPALREAANAPNETRSRRGYSEPSEHALAGLERARLLLDACDEPAPDRTADAAGFVSELSRVLPARQTAVDRPILNSVWFHRWSRNPRMTSCDSYVLASSGVNAPATLSDKDLLLNGDDLAAWSKTADKHLGKKHSGPLMTGHGVIDAEHRLNPRWGSDPNDEPRYETWQAPVAALQAGQIRLAAQRVRGDYMSVGSLMPADAETAVTIPAGSLSDIDKRSRKADIDGHAPVRMTLHAENGTVTQMNWNIEGTSRRDATDSERQVRASGSIKPAAGHAGTAPPSPQVAARPDLLATSLRFVSGGNKTADVDMRRWDPIKPLMITPAGAPADPYRTDRVSLIMPARID